MDEIDTTRQLHIDEALKLFQNALKLHSQGPEHYEEAAKAYDELFQSEIFKYPESATDYERAARPLDQELSGDAPLAAGLELPADADAEGTANSFAQALYLSYKNHGQFLLDSIRHQARKAGGSAIFKDEEVIRKAERALEDFAAALDRDPSDAELWRRTARVAAFLQSSRTSRYCLESAVEMDDDPAVVDVEPPSLAEALAGEQLKEILVVEGDDMALTHPIMKPFTEKEVPKHLVRFLDPIPFLPNPTKTLEDAARVRKLRETRPSRVVLDVPSESWTELCLALLRFVNEHGVLGEALVLELPQPMDVDDKPTTPAAPEEDTGAETAVQASEGDEPKLNEVEQQIRAEMEAASAQPPSETPAPQPGSPRKERRISMPTRKRSQSQAGINDNHEDENGDQKRSKRIRRRDTVAEEVMDQETLFSTQLAPFQAADQNLFQITKNMLENLGVTDKATLDRLAETLELCRAEERTTKSSCLALNDARNSLVSFDEEASKFLTSKKDPGGIGMTAFLEHSKGGSPKSSDTPNFDDAQGLREFAAKINSKWTPLEDVIFELTKAILSSYPSAKWSDAMKTAVVQVISHLDEAIYERTLEEIRLVRLEHPSATTDMETLQLLVQMLFELHVDVYERITNPSSIVEYRVRVVTKGRLDRWMDLASELARSDDTPSHASLRSRYLWASVVAAQLSEGSARDHVISCWASLRDYFISTDTQPTFLPNNIVMPEVSVAAADREVSKLTTMDFFMGLFQNDLSDPVSVIDSLEPVLNPAAVHVKVGSQGSAGGDSNGASSPKTEDEGRPITEHAGQGLQNLWRFLHGSSVELRLFLWARLGDAYAAIQYKTKQLSCHLKSLEMVVSELESESYAKNPDAMRKLLFMKHMKSIDELLVQALSLGLNEASSFDIINLDHVRSTSSALAKLSCLLHQAAMFEDEVRIGMRQPTSNSATYQSLLNKFRDMQVRTWCLQYTVLKAGMDLLKDPSGADGAISNNDLMDYLAAVHQVLGLRKCCKCSVKIFLKMMRIELLKQKAIENWEDHLGQVLYDLHGLKLGVGVWEVQDHGCPPEKLEKRNAMQLVEKVTILANRMPLKDLLKSDLKTTIEHMQQAIGQTKSNSAMIYNLRNFNEHLKKPLHPLRLYQAMKGEVSLHAVAVNTAESTLAKQGWFFLLGIIALTKFKGVDLNKRQTPGATDDLRMGATFLRLQLQFTPDKWDAWFRLAECFDYELDEAVLWSADKINKERGELIKLQRSAIHCYTLALSHSWNAGDSEVDRDALCELYYNFGMRLYASSREPFAMEAFQHADHMRFFAKRTGVGTFKKLLHPEMTDVQVWRYAASLFRMALSRRPDDWKSAYMLSKCIWKLYQRRTRPATPHTPREQAEEQAPDATGSEVDKVIAALERTVRIVSKLPKPRHGQDPILEPHYKILSIVHKLVTHKDITPQQGADILQRQPYAIQRGEKVTIDGYGEWEPYILKSLKVLRDKDRSNWQHRITIRHARILFDERHNSGYVQAKEAFQVLRESMFTKTMVMNVWKCDLERPGRHHVYTERYVQLMVKILELLNDRTNLEALLRRLRKKSADFYHFTEMWATCSLVYIRLLRGAFHIRSPLEDPFKHVGLEEFEAVADRITEWAADQNINMDALNCMRDAVEFKKLNGGLLRAGPIDDLISDCYAIIYFEVGPRLAGPPSGEEQRRLLPPPNDAESVAPETADTGKELGNEPGKEPGKEPAQEPAQDPSASATAPDGRPRTPNDHDGDISMGGVGAVSDSTPGPPGAAQTVTAAQTQPQTALDPAKPKRACVRRPDVTRKAEAAVLRYMGPNNATSAANNKAPGGLSRADSSSKGRLGSQSSGRNSGRNGQNSDDEDGEDAAGGGRPRRAKRGVNGGGSAPPRDSPSPAGSLQESADDESDLSEPPDDDEEDEEPALLFPNLRRNVEPETAAPTKESTGASEKAGSGNEDNGDEEMDDDTKQEGEGEGEATAKDDAMEE